MKQQPKILILGGTNFMGKALLDILCKEALALVVCINRGKVYWNNEARKEHPSVLNFYCDRKEHKDTTATIRFVSNHLKINEKNKWSCVVDFSAFRWRDVQSVTKAIQNIAQKYIFISTDSIYNNCSVKLGNPIREDDFDIQKEYQLLKASNISKDSYGYNKMKCEIYLNRVKPLPFICLRLPDVIGPFDNTERFWCTIRWIQQCNTFPLPLTADQETVRLSFVDSLSVADQIAKLISIKAPSTAYNLASLETPTLKQFIEIIASNINPDTPLAFKAHRNKESNHFYPSVECGEISSQKAIDEIGWSPLPLAESIQKSVQFFLKRGKDYPEEKREMQKQYRRKVIQKN